MGILRVFATSSISLALLCAATACNEKPANPVSQYGDALIGSYQKARNSADTANLEALKKAVQAYRSAHDEYPKSLKDIEQIAGGRVEIEKYDYDPASGAVSLKSTQ